MQLSFHGACREVTGSCHLLQGASKNILIDCGMFQGAQFAEEKNADRFTFDPVTIDVVLLTHAHMDHCGRLPKLFKEGYRGKIYATPATRDFAEIMLLDSARVIKEEAASHGHEPLYTGEDVVALMKHFEIIDYHKQTEVLPGVTVTAHDAGHILGSCFFEIIITEGQEKKTIVFSGDLGNPPAPIVRDTEVCAGADVVIMESTYGNRVHEPAETRVQLLRQAIIDTVKRGGVLMIPAFSLERTQEVLYELNGLVEQGLIPRLPIFVDSPLAIRALEIYRRFQNTFDIESRKLIHAGDDLFAFQGLKYTYTVEESKLINDVPSPKVVLAGSGMCNGGRIVHHLRRYLGDPKSHVLIISYQPEGSVGRKLLSGAHEVTIMEELVRVRASASAIGSYSSHADQPKLLAWVAGMHAPKPQQVFLVHGEPEAQQALADALQKQGGSDVIIPEYHKTYTV